MYVFPANLQKCFDTVFFESHTDEITIHILNVFSEMYLNDLIMWHLFQYTEFFTIPQTNNLKEKDLVILEASEIILFANTSSKSFIVMRVLRIRTVILLKDNIDNFVFCYCALKRFRIFSQYRWLVSRPKEKIIRLRSFTTYHTTHKLCSAYSW